MLTIRDLSENGFVVRSYSNVSRREDGTLKYRGALMSEYAFLPDSGSQNKWFVTGDCFGDGLYEISNGFQVLFSAAKNSEIHVCLANSLEFSVANHEIELLAARKEWN